jgi:hypothetical protein
LLGINPGGDPSRPENIVSASDSYFVNFEHDYLDCNYPMQGAMLPFLRYVLGASDEQIRRVPKTNLAFRRSRGEDAFKQYHSMTLPAAMEEARPALMRIVRYVQPKVILLETMKCSQSCTVIERTGGWSKKR